MIDAGWDIDVVGQSNYNQQRYPVSEVEFWEPLKNICISVYIENDWGLANIIAKIKAATKIGLITYDLSWIGPAVSLGEKLISQKNYDFIISRANPLKSHIAAYYFSKKYGIPWIANFNDPAPGIKYPPPYGKGPFSKVSLRMEKIYRIVSENADWLTFPSERLSRYICSYLGDNKMLHSKSSVIPHITLNRFKRVQKLNKPHFVMAHIGSVVPPRDSTTFLQGVKNFIGGGENQYSISVKFIGNYPEDLVEKIDKFGLQKVVELVSPVNYISSLEFLSEADVLVIIEALCPEGIFLPGKFVEYVNTGKPILALSPPKGTLKDILSSHGGGLAVDVGSVKQIAKAIKILYTHWESGTLASTYGSTKLQEIYCEKTVLAKYLDIFNHPLLQNNNK